MSKEIGNDEGYKIFQFGTYEDLLADFISQCEHPLYGRWNVPIWIDDEDEPEIDRLSIGITQARHGEVRSGSVRANQAHTTTLSNACCACGH